MRKLILTLVFCLSTSLAFGAPHYVFIEKSDNGEAEKGDVVAIVPATDQYEPTRAEKDLFYIIKVDLTNEDREQLIEPETESGTFKDGDGNDVPFTNILKQRKRKIDVDSLSITDVKQEITRTVLVEKVIDKSVDIIIDR